METEASVPEALSPDEKIRTFSQKVSHFSWQSTIDTSGPNETRPYIAILRFSRNRINEGIEFS